MDMALYTRAVQARDELIKREKGSYQRVASIAIVKEKGVEYSTNHACHAGLMFNGWGESGKGGQAVASLLMKPRIAGEMLYEDEALLFLDWLLNRSPYAPTFITKSPHEAIHHKAIISTGYSPSNLMGAGLVASRRLWEYPVIARVFCDLAKAGVNEGLAYYLAHIASTSFKCDGNIDWSNGNRGHCSISTYAMGRKEVKNFIEHKPTSLKKNYVEDCNYQGYDGMFGDTPGERLNIWIHANFPYSGEAKAGGANPFGKAVKGVKQCKYADGIRIMAEWQPTLMKYINEGKV